MASLDLFKDGLRWRVGDGQSIKIWKDQWLLTPSTYKVQSPMSTLTDDATMKTLMVEGPGQWNQDLLNQIFNPSEVQAISQFQ